MSIGIVGLVGIAFVVIIIVFVFLFRNSNTVNMTGNTAAIPSMNKTNGI